LEGRVSPANTTAVGWGVVSPERDPSLQGDWRRSSQAFREAAEEGWP